MIGTEDADSWAATQFADVAIGLGDFVTRGAVQELLQRCLIDAAASAIAARDFAVVEAVRKFASENFGTGPAAFWLKPPGTSTALGAAFVNSSAMSALDVDDGNRAARGHVSAAVIPVSVAVGKLQKASAQQFGHSILAGCEIAARLGAMERPAFSASGRWAGVGAAVAAGLLLKLDRVKLANAIAISLHASPMMAPAGRRRRMTGHIKEGVPFSVLTGLSATMLAADGYVGDPDAVESTGLYQLQELRPEDVTPSAFSRTYFKRYSCCRLAHSAIDAARSLMEAHGIEADDIEAIGIETFQTAIELPNEPRPSSFEAAQFSLPFCIALACVRGADALLPLAEVSLSDDRTARLANKVTLSHREGFDRLYPAGTPTRLTIQLRGGQQLTEHRDTADGDPSRPFSCDDLLRKFRSLAGPAATEDVMARMASNLAGGSLPSAHDYERLLVGI